MKPNYFLCGIIGILLLLIGSCCKDKATVPYFQQTCYNDTTQSFQFKDSVLEWGPCVLPNGDMPGQQFQYDYPCFNPRNPNQFCYVRTEYHAGGNPFFYKYGLFVHDFCHNNTLQISDGNIYGYCQWGKNDWIIYTGQDLQLYKIKSNGDSLTALTSDGDTYTNEIWSDDEKEIISSCYKGMLLTNAEGRVLDTLKSKNGFAPGLAYDWSGNILLLQQGEDLLSLYNLETKNYTELFKSSLSSSVYLPLDAKFFNNKSEVMWVNLHSLNRYNLSSRQNTEILAYKPISFQRYSPWLVNFAVSPDNKKVIFSHIDRHPRGGVDVCNIEAKQNLCIMNIDGSNMRMLILP